MDDIFRQVVLATGDENLRTAEGVGAIGLRFGLGADDPQVSARMGFGQAHGASPHARIHIGQVHRLQFFAGMRIDRHARTRCQHRVQAEREAGGVDHFFDLRRDRFGHAHAAELRIATDAHPSAFGVGFISINETCGGGYDGIVPVASFFIAATAERGDTFSGDFARFFKNCFYRLCIYRVCQSRQCPPKRCNIEHFIKDEAHIAQGRFVISHDKPRNYYQLSPSRATFCCGQSNLTTIAIHRVR